MARGPLPSKDQGREHTEQGVLSVSQRSDRSAGKWGRRPAPRASVDMRPRDRLARELCAAA